MLGQTMYGYSFSQRKEVIEAFRVSNAFNNSPTHNQNSLKQWGNLEKTSTHLNVNKQLKTLQSKGKILPDLPSFSKRQTLKKMFDIGSPINSPIRQPFSI